MGGGFSKKKFRRGNLREKRHKEGRGKAGPIAEGRGKRNSEEKDNEKGGST